MFSTNDDLSVVLFRMMVSSLSLAITLPSLVSKSYHVFILTSFVFILGKVVDNLEGFTRSTRWEMCIIYGVGCILGIIVLMYCLYYLGAVFNISEADAKNGLAEYPLLNNDALWLIPFLGSAYYIITDLYHLGCVLYKYYATKKRIIMSKDIVLK